MDGITDYTKKTMEAISSGIGAVFRYVNQDYTSIAPHFKILIGNEYDSNILYFLTCTSKNILLRAYVDINDVVCANSSDYCELTEETYILCNDIEPISVDDLIDKCKNDTNYKICKRISNDLLEHICGTIERSNNVSKKNKKIIKKSFEERINMKEN